MTKFKLYTNNGFLMKNNNLLIGEKILEIGDYYGGGIVIYTGSTTIIAAVSGGTVGASIPAPLINPPGYWLIVDPPDPEGNKVVGTGGHNTDVINTNIGESYPTYLIPVVFNLNYNGYTDWKVPSLYELREIYNKRAILGINWTSGSSGNYLVSSTLTNPYAQSNLWCIDNLGNLTDAIVTWENPFKTCIIRYV